jgi:hypothetical protein
LKGAEASAREKGTDRLPLLVWINVVLTFLFMQIGVPLVVYLVMTLALPPWRGFLVRKPPYCWCFLAIGAVLGFGSATRHYKRAKAKLAG